MPPGFCFKQLYFATPLKYLIKYDIISVYYTMPYYQTWEEFARAAEKLYLTDPMKVRVVLKYRHCDGNLCMKVTDDAVCLQYKTDQAQDVKKIEKLHGKLMRLMVSKESHSLAMETD
ncbi:signal recognition particle 9 kDa protein [Puntigrus tetrazona]|uniref:signal recognition particle 9 kDa protein n=1 Tax=Puntigrus tetrazona TaxID=1606681 RepID=UPI001C88F3D2|nr:signal recognition particle 9 kDa protein [Puntigrus tetrazona]